MRCRVSTRHKLIGLVALCALTIAGCVSDVSHENPFDPLSANPKAGGRLSGRIVLMDQPSVGVPGAVITTLPARSVAVADSQGYFAFPDASPDITALVAGGANVVADTAAVTLATGESRSVTIPLNAIPTVSSVRIITRKIDLWWPNPIYSASVTAVANDLNGVNDLDSMWVTVDSLSFGMTYSVGARQFQAVINASELPSNTLEWLIGRQVHVRARDKRLAVGVSAPAYVARIIENEAAPVFPAPQDTASASPEFKWTPPSALFAFSYTISVVRLDAGTQTIIWTQDGIGSYLRTFQYPAALQTGNYFWTIAVVDEYGNIAQSKESSFIVTN